MSPPDKPGGADGEAKRDATAILEAPSWAQGSIGVGVGAKAGRAAKNR